MGSVSTRQESSDGVAPATQSTSNRHLDSIVVESVTPASMIWRALLIMPIQVHLNTANSPNYLPAMGLEKGSSYFANYRLDCSCFANYDWVGCR